MMEIGDSPLIVAVPGMNKPAIAPVKAPFPNASADHVDLSAAYDALQQTPQQTATAVTPVENTITLAPAPAVGSRNVYPSQDRNNLRIDDDPSCRADTGAALDLLESKSPAQYAAVITYVGVVSCSSTGTGIYVWENPIRFQVGRTTRGAGPVWYASALAHDACHARQYVSHTHLHPKERVPHDVFTGRKAELECLAEQADALVRLEADSWTRDYVEGVSKTDWWEIPVSERW